MKIIIAYDDSEPSKRALNTLLLLAPVKPEVTLVMSLPGMALNAEGEPVDADPEDVLRAKEALALAREAIAPYGLESVKTEVLVGDAKYTILQKASDEQADLIITGCRGHGLAKRLVFGSVSNVILHEAKCPVMVVK